MCVALFYQVNATFEDSKVLKSYPQFIPNYAVVCLPEVNVAHVDIYSIFIKLFHITCVWLWKYGQRWNQFDVLLLSFWCVLLIFVSVHFENKLQRRETSVKQKTQFKHTI